MINCCVYGVPPAPVYKGARGEAGWPLGRAKEGGVLLLVGVGLPFPSPTRKRGGKEREGEGEGKRGCAPLPSPIRTSPWGGVRPPFGAFLSFPVWPIKAQYEFVTLRYSKKYPNHSEPFRSPNIVVQYIDLYVSAISRLLVMSPISSGTPNSFGTST